MTLCLVVFCWSTKIKVKEAEETAAKQSALLEQLSSIAFLNQKTELMVMMMVQDVGERKKVIKGVDSPEKVRMSGYTQC